MGGSSQGAFKGDGFDDTCGHRAAKVRSADVQPGNAAQPWTCAHRSGRSEMRAPKRMDSRRVDFDAIRGGENLAFTAHASGDIRFDAVAIAWTAPAAMQ
jgi:hypothetical protein